MKAHVTVVKQGKPIFSLEFPVLESDDPVTGISWTDGIKTALSYFHDSFPAYSLLEPDTSIQFGTLPDA